MSDFQFKRAHRSQARLRLALASVSGGGKTMGALRLARGLVEHYIAQGLATPGFEGKIAVIDTERRSASLYADVVPFDTLDLGPPYSVDRYQQAIHAAEQAGYLVCIIDQITHAWAGPGGQLEWIDTLKATSKNAFSPWMKVTPVQQEFYDRMLRSPMHIIATMRCKSEYVLQEEVVEGRTKKVPRKIGLSPVQREGIEYEFTACLDIDLESHMASASKDRTRLFDSRTMRLDESVGKVLAEWLLSGDAEQPDPKPGAESLAGDHSAYNAALAGLPKSEQESYRDGKFDATTGAVGMKPIEKLESKVCDYETAFVDVASLEDLAALFSKGQEAVRAFMPPLEAQTVKPFMARLIAAKDKHKVRLGGAAGGVGVSGQSPSPVGELPLDGGEEVKYVTPDDAAELERLSTKAGLTLEEGRQAAGVEFFGMVLMSQFSTACELIKLAGKQKKARAKRSREAA